MWEVDCVAEVRDALLPPRHRFAYAIVGLLVVASLICAGLVVVRILYSQTAHYWLIWTLTLACVPFMFAGLAYVMAEGRRSVFSVFTVLAAVVCSSSLPRLCTS